MKDWVKFYARYEYSNIKLLILLILWTIFLLFTTFSEHMLKISELKSYDNKTIKGIEQTYFDLRKGLTKEEQITTIESEHPSLPFRYWHKNKNKFAASPCGKLFSVLSLKFHNTYWQTFTKENVTVYLYNAYYDTRPKNATVVRLLAMSDTKKFRKLEIYCQLWYDDKSTKPTIVEVNSYTSIWPFWKANNQFYPYFINCPIPASAQNASIIPKAVSLVSERCATATNGLRIHYQLPTQGHTNGTKQKFAVCVKGLDYPHRDISARLVEWIELQLLLGASKIYFYQLGLHPNVSKVLEHYRERDLIDIRPITLADNLPSLASFQDYILKNAYSRKVLNEQIPYNDCLYRNLYRYDYIAVQDIDEVLMPLGNLTNWHDLMQLAVKNRTADCINDSFCFRNVYFSAINGTETAPYAPAIPSFLHMLQHIKRRNWHNPRGFNTKCFHGTGNIIATHNHLAHHKINPCKNYHFNLDLAQLQHYRSRPVLTKAVNDTSIWRFKHELQQRSMAVLRKLGFVSNIAYERNYN